MLRFGLWVRSVLVGLLGCAVDLRRQFIAQIDSETLSFSAPGFSFNARNIAWHPPLGSLILRVSEWLCLSVCADANAFCRGEPLVFVLGRLCVCVGWFVLLVVGCVRFCFSGRPCPLATPLHLALFSLLETGLIH